MKLFILSFKSPKQTRAYGTRQPVTDQTESVSYRAPVALICSCCSSYFTQTTASKCKMLLAPGIRCSVTHPRGTEQLFAPVSAIRCGWRPFEDNIRRFSNDLLAEATVEPACFECCNPFTKLGVEAMMASS